MKYQESAILDDLIPLHKKGLFRKQRWGLIVYSLGEHGQGIYTLKESDMWIILGQVGNNDDQDT